MDNKQTFQMPQMQPMRPMQPAQPVQSAGQPVQTPTGSGFNGRPMEKQPTPVIKKDNSGLIKTIAIIALALLAVTFIGLFIWKAVECNEAQTDLDAKISAAEAKAKDEQATKMEAEFLEREKYPYKTFSGPVDYGQLAFEYPKTWSVYVAEAATSGGDFAAYFNPIQVDAVSRDTINALRVTIRNSSFDDVTQEYQRFVDDKKNPMHMESVTIGVDKKITANRYSGTIPNTELSGFIVTFKIRDKTAVLETDSVLFEADFNKLLDTVTFNE